VTTTSGVEARCLDRPTASAAAPLHLFLASVDDEECRDLSDQVERDRLVEREAQGALACHVGLDVPLQSTLPPLGSDRC